MNRLAIAVSLIAALGCAGPRHAHRPAAPPPAPQAPAAPEAQADLATDELVRDALRRLERIETVLAADDAPAPRTGEVPASFPAQEVVTSEALGSAQESLARRMTALVQCMRDHAENIAHAGTPGYWAMDGHGRVATGWRKVRRPIQGALNETGRELDWAIDGAGMFQVQLPNNTVAYTRGGNFEIDREGNVVTPQGYVLQPNIQIPENVIAITVDQTGILFGFDPTNPGVQQELGQVQLFRFVNPAGLSAPGDNLHQETPASGNAIQGQPAQEQFGSIRQGYVEISNVEPAMETAYLNEDARAYELCRDALRRLDRAGAPADGDR